MKWVKAVLRFLGLLTDAATAVAPVAGASQKTQADLAKAKAAAQAVEPLAEKADAIVEDLKRGEQG